MASAYLISPPIVYSSYTKADVPVSGPPNRFEVNVKYHIHFSVSSREASSLRRSLHKKWVLHCMASPSVVADMSEEERKSWDSCRQALSSFSFDHEEQDKILGKAFGQIHSPYWGEVRPKETPRYEAVNEILNYLKSLSLSDEDLSKLLKKFPEVLGCNLEQEVKNNVAILDREWGINGKSLRNLLLRNPKVLGYNVDCKGSCVAQCTRCWVRF